MNENNITGPLLAVAITLILAGAGVAYWLNNNDPDIENMFNEVDTVSFSRRLISLTTETIANIESSDEEVIGSVIKEKMPGWVESNEYLIPDYSASITSMDVNITNSMETVSIPEGPSALKTKKGAIRPNSIAFGTTGGIPLFPTIISNIELDLRLFKDDDNSLVEDITVSYSTETVDPKRAMDRMMDLLEDDMNGWYSGMARDVEYMLNSLVKLRSKSGLGTGYTDTNYHLLNNGDVELAVNFALALRIARWTGRIPDTLVQQIDSYFSEPVYSPLMNPTGSRPWGEAEKDNYQDYTDRSRNEYPKRRASDILSIVESFGHADSADLFLRFLYMDRIGGSFGSKEPLDLISPLVEDQILDPRQPTDTTDPYALEHHPGFPQGKGIRIFEDITDRYEKKIDFRISADYLVNGVDINVYGIDNFIAWYTNADLSLTDDELINYGNLSGPITRCGLVPPPQEPPGRDHRIQWDLDISGRVTLEGSSSGWSGNTYSPEDSHRSVDLAFPVRIHSGTGRIYPEGFPGLFNINTGSQFRTNYSGGIVITPQANATEYYTARAWPEIKGAFEILTSLSRVAGTVDPLKEPEASRQNAHIAAMAAISSMSRWLSDTEASEKLGLFYLAKIKEPGIDLNDINPVRLDGHSLSFAYSPARDRMEIRSNLPEGDITIMIHPITGGNPYVTSRVRLDSGSRIELNLNEGTFSIHGNFAGYEVNEGSMIPKAPPDEVWGMLGSGTYITSVPMMIDTDNLIVPYTGNLEIPSSRDGEASVSLILTGEKKGSIRIDELPDGGENDIISLFHETIEFAENNDLNIGIRVELRQEHGPMITRSFIFGSLVTDDMEMIRSTRMVQRVINSMLYNTRIHVPRITGESIIITETINGWHLDMAENPTFVLHISPLGTPTTSYFSGIPLSHGDVSGWSMESERGLLPLW